MAPQFIFGTAGFGMDMTEFQDADFVKSLLTTLQDLGISHLDTAARDPVLNPGRSEELLGEARELSREFIVDTKVYTDNLRRGLGALTPEAISKSVDASLQRLHRPEGVNMLYAHGPDLDTNLEDQIKGFAEQIAKGHCKAWGVSNMKPKMLQTILYFCEKYVYPKPSYYQGVYNVITRGMEDELWRMLEANDMKFVAYWAVGAGFLTGKFVNGQHAGTRFADDNPIGKHMQESYEGEDVLEAVKKFDAETRALGLTPLEVSIRWIFHHSKLRDEDYVLLGASKVEHVVENVAFIRKGPLPESVLPLVEEVWDSVKESRGKIINGYSPSPGFWLDI
ncbi:putative oxidoreductase [Nemania sp. FL0916]|nr:putative oxidoreductase [Nemania sp. FL0916]